MVAFLGLVFGATLGFIGFLVMRNPYLLSRLSPWSEGYYQRLVLDTMQRNQLRVLGVLISLFGGTIGTACLGASLKSPKVEGISDGLLVLMGVLFFGCWIAGIFIAIWQLFHGRLFDWWKMWRTGMQLGPIEITPLVTPKMQKEARLFTYVFCALVCLAIVVGVVR